MILDIPEIERLSTEEKIQLVEDLWDSIQPASDALPVTEEERTILEARLEANR